MNLSSYRYSKINSCGLYGISGVRVEIEVSILPGLSSFEIVGLCDSAIRESRNRVHAAIKNNDYEFPCGRITVGMAPGFIRKEGTAFDLPIAIGVLAASRQIRITPADVCVIGEMSLKGEVRSIPGSINRILTARTEGIHHMIIPYDNLAEGGGIENIRIHGVRTLREAIDLLKSKVPWPDQVISKDGRNSAVPVYRDISSVIGQSFAVRALQIAAAGRHNLMMIGSPGCGKTTLANILPGLLPLPDQEEKIEVTKIYSSCGLLKAGEGIMDERPFRAPHHHATMSSMTGGGLFPIPGEITLAHKGILFLDEMNQFPQAMLDMLRQPMEEQKIRISRCRYSVLYPADFMLVGAANPCRCGYMLERDHKNPCTCSRQSIEKYFSNISGPIMDRMDLYIEMTKVRSRDLNRSMKETPGGSSNEIRGKVQKAWNIQWNRCLLHQVDPVVNARLPSELMTDVFEIPPTVAGFAADASEKLDLSVRGHQKMIRIARTIADYDGEEMLKESHIAQALQFRKK